MRALVPLAPIETLTERESRELSTQFLVILSGFAWTMLWSGGLLTIASIFPFAVVLAITVLEFAVAFLQAYVFAILVCIYLNDAINLH